MYTVVKLFIQLSITTNCITKNHTRASCAWVMSEMATTNILLIVLTLCLDKVVFVLTNSMEIVLLQNIIVSPDIIHVSCQLFGDILMHGINCHLNLKIQLAIHSSATNYYYYTL